MSAPRLEIDLDKIRHNARILVRRLADRGMSVTGVTKATLGSPEIARVMLDAGVAELGDARIENIEAMRRSHVQARMSLIRSPMLSQAGRVVASADVSFNTEIEVVRRLSLEAVKLAKSHAVVLMVELGDLREGIMPADLVSVVGKMLVLPNIVLDGLGTNLACRSGVSPDDANMGELSRLVARVEATFDVSLKTVSGGNSGNLCWSFASACIGRINNLRLGESILLGRETLNRDVLEGLHTDAITLVAEVIESKVKPSKPTGTLAQSAFGAPAAVEDYGSITQAILAIGVQDIEPAGLTPPEGVRILGCSSDHLMTMSAADAFPVGAEMTFQLDYASLIRAMTSPFVARSFKSAVDARARVRTA